MGLMRVGCGREQAGLLVQKSLWLWNFLDGLKCVLG